MNINVCHYHIRQEVFTTATTTETLLRLPGDMGMGWTNLPNVIYQHEIGWIALIVTHSFPSQIKLEPTYIIL